MTPNIPLAVRNVMGEYRRFLKTSYRFLDEGLRRQFEDHLEAADVVVRGPYVTLARDFQRGATIGELTEAGTLTPELLRAAWPFGEEPLFRHQELALAAGAAGRPFVVTSGTGSGKTESFLLPVLDGILRRKRSGVRGVQAILLYPMNALANDQLERLRRLLRGRGLNLSFGLYTGDSDAASQLLREEPAETERRTRQAIRNDPPDILLTNYKQLEFLLVRKEDRALFTPSLRFLVLDEVHSYRGSLATEIACLVRRLKAHAGGEAGALVAIATSATVGEGEQEGASLARFASTLFGEEVSEDDVFREHLVPFERHPAPWVPEAPPLSEADLRTLEPSKDASIESLAERLLGRPLPTDGTLAARIRAALEGNRVVALLEETFASPAALGKAVERMKELPERSGIEDEALRREIEVYLLIGSVGEEDDPPRLRPKLHTFFHGVYDVALCLDPACRALVSEGGTECLRCGAQARPAALCRTCGQDFVKIRYEHQGDNWPVGTGDFYSDERTAFLTHRIHELPETDGGDEENASARRPRAPRGRAASKKLEEVGVCAGCGRVPAERERCAACDRDTIPMLQWRGKLNTCPACGDVYTRGDIVTPLRTGTASSSAVLSTHHLDNLEGEDRKLLVFADNRQDVAHQAGYTADKHRSFALRHLLARELDEAGAEGLHLTELPQRLLDRYGELGIMPSRPTRPQRRRWLDALKIEAANEFTRHSRQRASLENLGLVAVEYEFLDCVENGGDFQAAAVEAELEPRVALALLRAVLDIMRKNRAVGFDFFREYIDPVRKRRYRELEEAPYNVRFPDHYRMPKAFAVDRPDHIRRSGRLMGFFQENKRAGQLTAIQKLAVRLIGDRDRSERFIRSVVRVLLKDEIGILKRIDDFPIPKNERVQGLDAIQIDPEVIRLVVTEGGFRCNACQVWRSYRLPFCPSPRCRDGSLQPASPDRENYYVGLYRERPPRRLAVAEHSAQISGEERARRETEFKRGRLDVLVCSPTLELGVDIGPLLTVVLRNAPPTPANYVQRVGRAGRRLRIGFASTFCAGGHHDRHAFEEPEWLVAGRFEPPRLRLDNPHIVRRHLRSHLLESLEAEIPTKMGALLDDLRTPAAWKPQLLAPLFDEIEVREVELVGRLASLFERDRNSSRMSGFDVDEVRELVRGFEASFSGCLDGWWRRVKQLDTEFREYSTVGSPRKDQRKAEARRRAYYELTQDPESAYSLNYLAMQGLLPAYQFPADTFSLDPGVADTQTIYRPASIAIEEFAPGNYVYANGRKLRSIRVLFSGGPGGAEGPGRSDAETAGRLQSFHFCERCDEVLEAPRNNCPRCTSELPGAVDAIFVEAFEAEEALRIGSDEESRQRQFHVRRESLLPGDVRTMMYPYPLAPAEHGHLATLLVTNWGRAETKTGDATRYWLCPDCGRHLPHERSDPSKEKQVRLWLDRHERHCSGQLAKLILGHRFETDCLTVTMPTRSDAETIGRSTFSPTLVTLAEALLAGASSLLEMEPHELHAFVRNAPQGSAGDQIVFYETVPGGAGYVEEVARRLPDVARSGQRRLYGHSCSKACYLCLKHYRNQRWHPFFDKDGVRDLLLILSNLDPVEPTTAEAGAGMKALQRMLAERTEEMHSGGADDPASGRYRKGAIEEPLREALERSAEMPPGDRACEIRDDEGRLITVPDFAWRNVKLAVYCDGFAFHGDRDTLELDAKKRNFLQSRGWAVLTYWGRTILRDPDACAEQVAAIYRQRLRTM